MIIEVQNQLEIENVGVETENIEAGIDASSMPFLFEMLSRSFYSNPIGSICREITSNCFDSHIEANVDEPVVIKKGYDEEGTYISFVDFGIGISPERIKKIYMNYFSSTKRDTNDQIGGFGLGSKSPLSYTDYFYINTISNGIKYQYVFSKGKIVPTLDLLNTSETTEHNGTEIRIYINDDSYTFRRELLKQLCYFDNVYFDNWSINNNYRIYEGKYFKFNNSNPYDTTMHIILNKVAYPIDWHLLGINSYNIAVGVKFTVGELQVTPNREQLRYTESTIQLIKDRIALAINELITLYKNQNQEITSYFEWLRKGDERPNIRFTAEDGTVDKLYLYGVKELDSYVGYKYLKGLEQLTDVNLLSLMYSFSGKINNHKFDKKSRYYDIQYELKQKPRHTYIAPNHILSADKNWLVESGNVIYPVHIDKYKFRVIFKKVAPKLSQNTKNTLYFNLGAGLKLYKLVKALRAEVADRCSEYRPLTDDEYREYEEYKRANNSSLQKRLQGKVFVTDIGTNKQYDWNLEINHSKHDKSIANYKGFVIYGFKGEENKLDKAIAIIRQVRENYFTNYNTSNPKRFKVLKISKQNEKYFKNYSNMTHVDNFFSDNIIFRDFATSLKIEYYFNNIQNKSEQSTQSYIKHMRLICAPIGDALEQLYQFYHSHSPYDHGFKYTRDQLSKEIIAIAQQHDLFNPNIELIFKQINDWYKDIEIIRYVPINSTTLPHILKLLYEKKKKLNPEYYQKVLNTDPSIQLKLNFEQSNVIVTKYQSLTQTINV